MGNLQELHPQFEAPFLEVPQRKPRLLLDMDDLFAFPSYKLHSDILESVSNPLTTFQPDVLNFL